MMTIEPDINLIKLAEPIELGNLSKFTPVCVSKMSDSEISTESQQNQTTSLLDDKSESTEKTCFSSGWGKLKFGKFNQI